MSGSGKEPAGGCCCCLVDACPGCWGDRELGCTAAIKTACRALCACRYVCFGSTLESSWSHQPERGRCLCVCCCSHAELVNPVLRVKGRPSAANQCEGCLCLCCGSYAYRADYCTVGCCGGTADRADCAYQCCGGRSEDAVWDGACCGVEHRRACGWLWPCVPWG